MVGIAKNPSFSLPKIHVSELFHNNNSFKLVQSITGLSADRTIALSDDHLTMVVGSSQVTVYKFQQGTFNAAQTISRSANSVDLSADGEWLAIGGSNTRSWLYHLENSVYVLNQTFTHSRGSTHVKLAAEAPVLVLRTDEMYEVYVLEDSQWKQKQQLYGDTPRKASLSSKG